MLVSQTQTSLARRTVLGLGGSPSSLEGWGWVFRGPKGEEPALRLARRGAAYSGPPQDLRRGGWAFATPEVPTRRGSLARCPETCRLRRVLGLHLPTWRCTAGWRRVPWRAGHRRLRRRRWGSQLGQLPRGAERPPRPHAGTRWFCVSSVVL